MFSSSEEEREDDEKGREGYRRRLVGGELGWPPWRPLRSLRSLGVLSLLSEEMQEIGGDKASEVEAGEDSLGTKRTAANASLPESTGEGAAFSRFTGPPDSQVGVGGEMRVGRIG